MSKNASVINPYRQEDIIFSKNEQALMEYMENIDIIDSHEHLPPEAEHLQLHTDVFTLFSHYTKLPLWASGMKPEDKESLHNPDIPIEKRWQMFRPHFRNIRLTSYARAAFISAKEIYGFDDINDETYQELSERINEMNKPGIYRHIFDHCRIRASITQCTTAKLDKPLVPVMQGRNMSQIRNRVQLEELEKETGVSCKTLEDYLELCKLILKRWESEGCVGIKFVSQTSKLPDIALARESFSRLMAGEELSVDSYAYEPLEDYLMHKIIDFSTELNLVIAMHSGVWGDFRNLDPRHMNTIAPMHPEARFDLYHVGVPDIRAAIIVGVMQPNVWTNFCWIHIISQEMACAAINEILDTIPLNKISAFGGDYKPIEKIPGHLRMARENIARVLAGRIDKGKMDIGVAKEIIKKWFWENPLQLYNKIIL